MMATKMMMMVVVGRIMIIFVKSVRASRESVDDEDNGISDNKAYAGNNDYDDADDDVYNAVYETVLLLLLLLVMMTNMMMTMMAITVIMRITKMIMRW